MNDTAVPLREKLIKTCDNYAISEFAAEEETNIG
jgi:hypothetical protein